MFHNWRDALFLLAIIGVPVCSFIAWVRRSKTETPQIVWREKVGLIALIANALAVATPFAVFAYQFSLMKFRPTFRLANWLAVLDFFFICSIFALISSFLSPARYRLPLIVANLLVVFFFLSIPIGIL